MLIYKETVIYSVFLYGSETWTMNKHLEDRNNAFQLRIYRIVGSFSRKEKTDK
uniref:Uncharacterized protein n=1 Tax=Arion vulgaris TaxID=1028688 RepID=A0A0B7BHD3_9EUPU